MSEPIFPNPATDRPGDLFVEQRDPRSADWKRPIVIRPQASSVMAFDADKNPETKTAAELTAMILAASETVSGRVELATAAETITGTDQVRATHPAGVKAAIDAAIVSVNAGDASMFNLRPPRPGVYFDGTSGSRITSTLGNQNIATDPYSFAFVFEKRSGTQRILNVSSSATSGVQARALQIDTGAFGGSAGTRLVVLVRGATSADYRYVETGDISSFDGKTVTGVVVHNGASAPLIYLNGVLQSTTGGTGGASPPAWGETITSTYLGIGYLSSGNENVGAIYSVTPYNLALSQTDAEEIYFNGGRVPFRYQWGSQVNRVFNPSAEVDTSNVSTEANTETHALTRNTSSPIAGAGDFKLAVTVAGGNPSYPRVNFATTSGNKDGLFYRVTFKTKVNSGTCNMAIVRLTGVSGGGASPTNWAGAFTLSGSQTHEFLFSPADVGANDNALQIQFDGTATFDVQIDDVVLIQRGAVAHYALDEGIGYQLHDASSNKLDAVMTTTGVHHLIAKREGYVRGTLTWAGTHEPKSLLGNVRDLPNEAVVTLITTKATAATTGSGVSIGSVNTIARYVAANAITTAKKLHTLSNAMPSSSVDGDCTLAMDPDTNNYTGSITLEVHYRVTEGTP